MNDKRSNPVRDRRFAESPFGLSVVQDRVWHGSRQKFRHFEAERPAKRTHWRARSTGHFFAPTQEIARTYGPYARQFWIDLQNPFCQYNPGLLDDEKREEMRWVTEPMFYGDDDDPASDGVLDKLMPVGGLSWWVLDTPECVQRIVELGYDGSFVGEEEDDGNGWTSFFVLTDEQIAFAK